MHFIVKALFEQWTLAAALLELVLCNDELPLHPNEFMTTFGSCHDSRGGVSNVKLRALWRLICTVQR